MLTDAERQALEEFISVSRATSGVIYEDSLGAISVEGAEPAKMRVKLGRLVQSGLLVRRQDTIQVRNPAFRRPKTMIESLSSSFDFDREPEFLDQRGRAYWELSEQGLDALESGVTLIAASTDLEIPAADRVVRLGDNLPERDDAGVALDNVISELSTQKNDLPLSHEEVEVARTELSALRQRLDAAWLRVGDLTAATAENGIVRWLADKAAGTAVGALALAALAAIGRLIGVL